jgi:O-Antigen ligase
MSVPVEAPADGPVGTERGRLAGAAWPTLLVAGVLCLIAFVTGGGLNPVTTTPVEIALTLGSGIVVAAAVVLTPAGRPAFGLWSVGLLLAFAALSGLSVVWSVAPDASWQDAGRLLSYSAVFALAAMLVRAAPARWSAVLGGVVLAAVAVCVYALLTKALPGRVGVEQTYARLQEPFGYWNAIGLTAALGAVGCMWLGARRAGHALLGALAYPAMGIMWVTLLLAYSRGALAALVLGLALWLALVPLRLRGAAVLLAGALGGGAVVAWDFSRPALTTDNLALVARAGAGHQLGVLLAAMVVLLTLTGLGVGFATAWQAPSETVRRRAGALLLCLPAIAVLAFAGLLATSHRGFFGSISHGVGALTNPDAPVPANGPGRLTAIGSVRARYWNEALEIFQAHPVLGVGAAGYETARLRYRTETLYVKQAHGYIVQTLADLGAVGLLVTLALLAAWLAAAGRATHPFNRRWAVVGPLRDLPRRVPVRWRRLAPGEDRYTPERVGLLTMLCLVVTFGIHSFVDWTWYVPGDACVALLCAGWLAGRGPLVSGVEPAGEAAPAGASPPRAGLHLPALRELDPLRGGIAVAVLIAALLAAWVQWQPQRSVDASDEALALIARDPAGALAAARTAVNRDPLSAEALLRLAAIQQGAGESAAARATLEHAVHLQPSNPQTWQALGEYDLQAGNSRAALNEMRAAVYLNPEAVAPRATIEDDEELLSLQDEYLQALRAVAANGGVAAPRGG